MPVLIGIGKFLLGVIASTGVYMGVDALISSGQSQSPAVPPVTTTFDWQGMLTSIGIALGVAFIAWLILRRR